jgi:hypothetical protein
MTAATAGTSIQRRRRVTVILRGIMDRHEVRMKRDAISQFWKLSLSTFFRYMFPEGAHFSGNRFINKDLCTMLLHR